MTEGAGLGDPAQWLVQRYGNFLIALLLLGVWQEGAVKAFELRRYERLPEWIKKMASSPYQKLNFPPGGGVKLTSNIFGKIRAQRQKILIGATSAYFGMGLLLLLQQMNAGMFSTLFAGIVRTWSAAGADNWSTAGAWSGGAKPAAGDDVVFDGTSTQNCTINEAVAALTSYTVSGSYTGTINLTATGQTNGNFGAMSIAGGTHTYSGVLAYTLRPTSLTMTGGTMALTANGLIHILGAANTNISGGTWTSGIPVLIPSSNQTHSITIPIQDIWVLEVTNETTQTFSSSLSCANAIFGHAGGDANKRMTVSFGTNNLACSGNLEVGTNYQSLNNAILTFSTGTLSVTGTTQIGNVTENPNSAISFSGAGSATFTGNFTINQVVSYLVMGSAAWSCGGNWTDVSTSASWNSGTATLTLTGTSPTWRQDSASDHIYNFRFNGSGTFAPGTGNFRCANQMRLSAATVSPTLAPTVGGQLLIDGATLNGGALTWTIGSISHTSGTVNTTTTVFNVSGAFSHTGGAFGSNSAYTLNVDGDFTTTGTTFNAPSGTGFKMAGANTTIKPTTFNHDSGTTEWDRNGNQSISVNSGITFSTIKASTGGVKTFDQTEANINYTTKTETGATFAFASTAVAAIIKLSLTRSIARRGNGV